jgi:hypothetical protein
MVVLGLAVFLLVSAALLITSPRAPNSQVAMGQGLPSTSFGETTVPAPEILEPVALQFLPDGFTLASEESDGIDRVVQRYRRELVDGRELLVVTTVDGTFDADRALGANEAAELVPVGDREGVALRGTTEAGEDEVVVRVQVDADHNVIVRGVGGVSLDDVIAVAAGAQTS